MSPGEGHHEHGIRGRDAETHNGAHHRGNAQSCAGQKQSPDDACQRASQRGENDERIQPALKIYHEQQIDQRHRHQQTHTEADETRAHGLRLPAQHD